MTKKLSTVRKLLADVKALWDESFFRSDGEPTTFYKFVHFWMLVVRSFVRNRCLIRAAALSFATLLAIIPLLAVAVSVTGSLLKQEGEERIEQFVDRIVSTFVPPGMVGPEEPLPAAGTNQPVSTGGIASTNGTPPGLAVETNAPPGVAGGPGTSAKTETRISAQKQVVRQINEFIETIRGGSIKVIGMVGLILAAIGLLRNIEATFNDIWGVTRGRSWLRGLVLYWTTITLGPLLIAAGLGAASGPRLEFTQNLLESHPVIRSVLFSSLSMIMLWLAFALFYAAVPNTKVRFNAALVGGIVGGSAWYLNNALSFLFVSKLVTNFTIYGGLFTLPVFMLGLYTSWVIVLFGSQVAYAYQNRALYLQEKLAENVNQRGREFVALRLMTCIGQRFQRGLPAPTIEDISRELGIPSRLAQQVLHTLIAARLVIEISGTEAAYTPARPLESINAHHVLMALRATVGQELMTRDEPVREEVFGEFARIQEAEKLVASSVTLLALVNRAQARIELAPPAADQDLVLKPALAPAAKPAAPAEQFEASEAPTQPAAGSTAEWTGAPAATETAPSPQRETRARSVVAPTTEEERDFPL